MASMRTGWERPEWAFPPRPGVRVPTVAVVMGLAEILAGVILLAIGVGLAAAQRSLDDPLWIVGATVGLLPPIAVICLGVSVIRVRSSVAAATVDPARAWHHARRLLGWWITLLLVTFLAILVGGVGLMLSASNTTVGNNLALDAPAITLLPVVAAIVGMFGSLVGRGLLLPPTTTRTTD